MSSRRFIPLAVALVTALCGASTASASHTPPFTLGGLNCVSGGIVQVKPPSYMRSVYDVNHRNAELVKWSPDLQVRTGSRWRNYDTRRPFYSAFTTNGFGYSNTIYGQGWGGKIGQVQFVPFTDLPAGTYRIKHWLYWQQLGKTYAFTNRQTCRFV